MKGRSSFALCRFRLLARIWHHWGIDPSTGHEAMKRSRTTALLLMSAAPLLFTACQKEPEVKVQEGLYTSVEACTEATGDLVVPQRLRRSAEAGRRCGAEVRQQGSLREGLQAGAVRAAAHLGRHVVHRPDDDGLLHVADAEQPRRPGAAGTGVGAGLPGQECGLGAPGTGGTGGLNTASGIGAGKAGLAPVTSEPNRAVTASRGGFGNTSARRSSSGSYGG